ncbi:MAG: hypothetical protein NTV68_06550 [Methanomicrobiales archaeon]|nr:hypothetical protein [Methanomicrobiales archaeon]
MRPARSFFSLLAVADFFIISPVIVRQAYQAAYGPRWINRQDIRLVQRIGRILLPTDG